MAQVVSFVSLSITSAVGNVFIILCLDNRQVLEPLTLKAHCHEMVTFQMFSAI